ncbi:uncharacterized protein LOC130895956 [Diorhabda carinulata]|uniref:uncharacterized protein LOC130895956 n=1 Tax=Diorhabda carinulata TaxID=1163345 RepID=UPI00259FF51D|nr:uncharacterized protein LOC130895956 [Diorhabda carinulata]
MSPKKLIISLQQKCLKIVYNKLYYAIDDEDPNAYLAIRKCLPRNSLLDLLKRLSHAENLDRYTRFNCLQLLLREGSRELDTGIFPRIYYDKILKVILDRGQRLQHLNFKGVWIRDFPDLLSKVIRNSPGLKTLIIPQMANNEVLEAINTLEYLTVLDISGESYFTVNGIKKLSNKTLQVLDLGYAGDSCFCQEDELEEPELEEEEGSEDEENEEEELNEFEDGTEERDFQLLAEIIENLPALISLKTYSFTGNAISVLKGMNPNYKTNLKFLHDSNTSVDIMDSVVSLCPDLEDIHLEEAESDVLEDLYKLSKLNTLQLTKCYIDEFLFSLDIFGGQLQVLKLNNMTETHLDLSDLCISAPNLHTIELYQMKLAFTNKDNYFGNLNNMDFSYCETTSDTMLSVLRNSPSLKVFRVLECLVNLSDKDIFDLCSERKLESLEKLWFSSAGTLTAASVEMLMESCPNLVQIGELDGWDVTKEDMVDLRAVIKATNIDLKITPR